MPPKKQNNAKQATQSSEAVSQRRTAPRPRNSQKAIQREVLNSKYIEKNMRSGNGSLAIDLASRMPNNLGKYGDLVRAMVDPAHANGQRKIAPLPDGKFPVTTTRTVNWNTNIEVNAGEKCAIYSTPFFEVPFASRQNDGVTCIGIINPLTSTSTYPSKWMIDNKVWAWRCLSQSVTLTNVSSAIKKGGSIHCNRYPSSVRHIDVTAADASVSPTISSNGRVMYAMPGKTEEVTAKPGFEMFNGEEGAYLISKPENFEFVINKESKYDGLVPGLAAPAASTLSKRLAFSDWASPDTYQSCTYNANVLTVSYPGNMDTVAAVINAPASDHQTFNLFMSCTYEFVPRTDCTIFNYELQQSTMDMKLVQTIVQFIHKEKGLWPASYNGFGDVFKKFKDFIADKARSVKNFYKSNSKVIGPALDLIPGMSIARGVVDQYI